MSAGAIDRSSFAGAARLLPPGTGEAARRLYAACRAVDDLADETGGPEGAAALAALDADLRSGRANSDVSATFLELRAERGLSLGPARALIATAAGDLAHRPFQTKAELTAYADGVAGTVGLMMCDILAVRGPAARERARRLGRAMQLTNIARDVVEDARMRRRYLPASWGAPPVEALADPDAPALSALRQPLRRALALAERDYAAGLDGLRALEPRARPAVAVAARLYRDVGREIAASGFRPPRTRAGPGSWRRARLIWAGVLDAASPPRAGARHA